MAIDTTNEKLALMEEELWEPALPIAPGTFGQDDKQQLLWGFPGISWVAGSVLEFIADMNTRIKSYLTTLYTVNETTADATTLARRYLDAAPTADATVAFQTLIDDATP